MTTLAIIPKEWTYSEAMDYLLDEQKGGRLTSDAVAYMTVQILIMAGSRRGHMLLMPNQIPDVIAKQTKSIRDILARKGAINHTDITKPVALPQSVQDDFMTREQTGAVVAIIGEVSRGLMRGSKAGQALIITTLQQLNSPICK